MAESSFRLHTKPETKTRTPLIRAVRNEKRKAIVTESYENTTRKTCGKTAITTYSAGVKKERKY